MLGTYILHEANDCYKAQFEKKAKKYVCCMLADYVFKWYESKTKLLKPPAIRRRESIIISLLNLTGFEKLRFRQLIREYIKKLTINNDFKVVKAPQIKWKIGFI